MATYSLSPLFNGWQGFDANGRPLNGGLINCFLAGSSTPTATYTTSSGLIQNTNPIILGVDGRPPQEIWLLDTNAYKFVLTDSLSNVLGTYDNVAATNSYTPPGTGGLVQSVSTKLSQWTNLIDYSTVANALAYSKFANASAGTYNLGSSTLFLPAGTKIIGAGSSLVNFTYSGAGVAFDGYGNNNITIQGISITCTNPAAIAIRLGGSAQHFELDDVQMYGDTSLLNTGTGLLLESSHTNTAFSGNLSAINLYTLGFKFGVRFLGDSVNVNRTWTTCSFIQCFLLGRGSGIIAGSKGFYIDNYTSLSGSSFSGGTVEGFDTGLSIDTCTYNNVSGIDWDSDIEQCNTIYVIGNTFAGHVNLNPSAKQYKASSNGTANVWSKELTESGIMARESYYDQKSVIYNSGVFGWYTGASLINYGTFTGGGVPTFLASLDLAGNYTCIGSMISTGSGSYQKSATIGVGAVTVTSSGNQTQFPIVNGKTMTFTTSFGKLFIITIGATGDAGIFFASYSSATITSLGPLPTTIELSATPATGHIGITKAINSQVISVVAGATAGTTLTSISISIIGSDQLIALPTNWA